MTGPEHYREAETDIEAGDRARLTGSYDAASTHYAAAQVHATLALAGATALASDEALPDAWYEVLD